MMPKSPQATLAAPVRDAGEPVLALDTGVVVMPSPERRRRWRGLLRRLPVLDVVALCLVVILLLLIVAGPWLERYPPNAIDLTHALLPPGPDHWLGTDDYGRDIYSRLVAGARVTLLAALIVVVLGNGLGVLIACLAAISAPRVDQTIMRICDIFMAFPAMVLALGIAAALGPSELSLVIAMTVSLWPGAARLARGLLRETMLSDHVAAAKVMGVGVLRRMFRHVLPSVMDQIYVRAALEVAGAIVIFAGLAFLGVGAQPPSPDWGAMVSEGREFITSAWWIAAAPGAMITLTAIAFGLAGDAIAFVLNPAVRDR